MIVVRTGSRLHFGLLDPGGLGERRYGGAGVMIEEPRLEVAAERLPGGQGVEAEGPLRARVLLVAKAWARARRFAGGLRIRVRAAPPEHAGLGTGTQLTLAVGCALERLCGKGGDAFSVARLLGRGRRSAIGIHGFLRGGFLADRGIEKRPAEVDEKPQDPARGGKTAAAPGCRAPGGPSGPAPLLCRIPVPPQWRFLVIAPCDRRGIHGVEEEEAFASLEDDPARIEARSRLLLGELLPALERAEFERFAAALGEYGRLAAFPFAKRQGGTYAHPLVREVLAFLESLGIRGLGQSSWGPAGYALFPDADSAFETARTLRRRFDLSACGLAVSAARNRGAEIDFVEAALDTPLGRGKTVG